MSQRLRAWFICFPVRVNRAQLGLIGAFVGVCAEVVALRLREILRQVGRAVGVEVGEARSHRQDGDAVRLRDADRRPPVTLRPFHPRAKIFVEE